MLSSNTFKFLPNVAFSNDLFMNGELQFKNPYHHYPEESNLFYEKDHGFFRLQNVIVSCFSMNPRCYLENDFWNTYGGNGNGICLGFNQNMPNGQSMKYMDVRGRTIFATLCQYIELKNINQIDIKVVTINDIKEFVSDCVYIIPKNTIKKHEQELRLFTISNQKVNEINVEVKLAHYFYLNNVILGNKVSSSEIYKIQLYRSNKDYFKLFQIGDDGNTLNIIPV
jgi:hypothetical protein